MIRGVAADGASQRSWHRAPLEEESTVDTTYPERNEQSSEQLRQLVERLSDDDLRRELPGGWTVADTLGHLAFYDRRAALLLERFAREGVFASPYDYDTINDVLLNFTRRMAPRAAAEEAINAAEAADRAASALPPALLDDIHERKEVKPDRSEHRLNHLADIEAALAAG
jgi:hypothetical protein